MEDLRALGSIIRQRRKEAQLSIDDAAELLGVGRRLLIELEHGNRRASVDTVLRTLSALGLELQVEPKRLGASAHVPSPQPGHDVTSLLGSPSEPRRSLSRKKKTGK